MRYTRNRQLVRIHKGFMWRTNVRIDRARREYEVWGLDPTFKWHRDFHGMNIVSFNRKGESFKTYVIKGRK